MARDTKSFINISFFVKRMLPLLSTLGLIGGLTLLVYASDRAVVHSVLFAKRFKIPPIVIGLILASIGTDLPEITNSIFSSAFGHGDINIGDSLGSALTQITLILGLLPIVFGSFKIKRRDILLIGACELLALSTALFVMSRGYFTRFSAFILLLVWFVLMLICVRTIKIKNEKRKMGLDNNTNAKKHLLFSLLAFVGVTIASYVTVKSTIILATFLKIPEYLLSFFALSIGTSLPELAVDLAAVRKKQYSFAIGDLIGSSIVDATFSIGIGQLLFPTAFSRQLILTSGFYTLIASAIIIALLFTRKRLDKLVGIIGIVLYIIAYFWVLG